MKNFTLSSILALSLALLSACSPSSQNKSLDSSEVQNSDSIIGGRIVVPGSDLSKQVFMLYAMSSEGQSICTATLITRHHILTAAHCVDGVQKMFAVFAIDGVSKIRSGSVHNNPDIVQVSTAVIYPKWGGTQNGKVSGMDVGDIAVLKLSKPAPAHMKVTRLHNSALRKGQVLIASGYGIVSGVIRSGSGLLRETRVVVEEPLLGNSEFYVDQKNGRGICSGDSGGPSFVQSPFGELVQVGITSRGDSECAEAGLYTLVPAYSNWITSTVQFLK